MDRDHARTAEFEDAMAAIYVKALQLGYRANDYKVMLDRLGALETARRCVLNPQGVPSGVFRLMELGAPEISVEAVVTSHEDLFSDDPDLVAVARERLKWMSSPEAQARARELRSSLQKTSR